MAMLSSEPRQSAAACTAPLCCRAWLGFQGRHFIFLGINSQPFKNKKGHNAVHYLFIYWELFSSKLNPQITLRNERQGRGDSTTAGE